jgi:hypothetical protein
MWPARIPNISRVGRQGGRTSAAMTDCTLEAKVAPQPDQRADNVPSARFAEGQHAHAGAFKFSLQISTGVEDDDGDIMGSSRQSDRQCDELTLTAAGHQRPDK